MPFDVMMSNPQVFFGMSEPASPQEGEVYMDQSTGMLRMYMNGEWVTPGFENYDKTLQAGESYDSAIRKHHKIIAALVDMVTELQLKVQKLEKIVGTEDRFKNIIREIQDGKENEDD